MHNKVCSDAEGLTIDSVPEEVDGEAGAEIREFVITRHELGQIFMYWANRRLENEYRSFAYGNADSTDIRLNEYAESRLNRAAKLLSEEEINNLIADAEDAFREKHKVPHEVWKIFKRQQAVKLSPESFEKKQSL